ncbi:hypothetical protein [Gluconacetobacter entanii]|uniref:hypothetical protein n=1 Tax=Gluconacetobacter entanii TaxID=108528 RepID=UPI0021BBEF79|nr:hypothetical protein [Gluconacetobacter entanii]MCW4581607.1 hypothetical protein [Gluconacetobacter entanii]MCW4584972.1 hypothetical protein [Gluconacetobacter entanii]MCW4588386.1 hypothetical protein [Gluconacetobacter entanii]
MMYRDILKRLRLEQFVNSPIVSTFSPFVMIAVGVFLMLMVGGVTMSTNSQALVSCGTLLLFFVLKGRKGRGITCFLMMLSLLVLAELYALMTLCLCYFQMSWPLDANGATDCARSSFPATVAVTSTDCARWQLRR